MVTVVLAGATGNLGSRVVSALVKQGASVRALVKADAKAEKIEKLAQQDVQVVKVDYSNLAELTDGCRGATCVVSTLQGLRDVIVDAQSVLLAAAVKAGAGRFIPSDFALDFNKLASGENRNLDLRREFRERLERSSIPSTSILNGAFMDLLTGQAPIIVSKLRQVLYWEEADQLMDFTTMDDTAAYTARAATDESAPAILRIAGDQVSARQLVTFMNQATGDTYHLFHAGGLGTLEFAIKTAHAITPNSQDLYPAWQGMQYLHNMFSGRGKLQPLDNDRYAGMKWTSVPEVLAAHWKN